MQCINTVVSVNRSKSSCYLSIFNLECFLSVLPIFSFAQLFPVVCHFTRSAMSQWTSVCTHAHTDYGLSSTLRIVEYAVKGNPARPCVHYAMVPKEALGSPNVTRLSELSKDHPAACFLKVSNSFLRYLIVITTSLFKMFSRESRPSDLNSIIYKWFEFSSIR